MRLTEDQILEMSKIFDDIITSDSVAVQSAFQRLALLSSLAKADREDPGPFEQLVRQLDWMETQVKELQRSVQILENGGTWSGTTSPQYSLDPTMITISGMSNGITLGGSGVDIVTIGNITLNPPHVSPLTADDIIKLTDSNNHANS
jgi:hypothetical protein